MRSRPCPAHSSLPGAEWHGAIRRWQVRGAIAVGERVQFFLRPPQYWAQNRAPRDAIIAPAVRSAGSMRNLDEDTIMSSTEQQQYEQNGTGRSTDGKFAAGN